MDEAPRYLAEIRIAAAVADGVFEDLPGRGAPLKLEDDAAVPPEWRLAYRLLRSAGFAPGGLRWEAQSGGSLIRRAPVWPRSLGRMAAALRPRRGMRLAREP